MEDAARHRAQEFKGEIRVTGYLDVAGALHPCWNICAGERHQERWGRTGCHGDGGGGRPRRSTVGSTVQAHRGRTSPDSGDTPREYTSGPLYPGKVLQHPFSASERRFKMPLSLAVLRRAGWIEISHPLTDAVDVLHLTDAMVDHVVSGTRAGCDAELGSLQGVRNTGNTARGILLGPHRISASALARRQRPKRLNSVDATSSDLVVRCLQPGRCSGRIRPWPRVSSTFTHRRVTGPTRTRPAVVHITMNSPGRLARSCP